MYPHLLIVSSFQIFDCNGISNSTVVRVFGHAFAQNQQSDCIMREILFGFGLVIVSSPTHESNGYCTQSTLMKSSALHAARIDAWHCDGHYYLVCEKLSKKLPKKVTAKEVGDVVDLFQRMHNLGIHHGDTHDGNMMYDRKGRLKCIDLDTRRTTDSLFLSDGFPTFGRWTKDQRYEILAEKCIRDYKLFIAEPRFLKKFCSKKFRRFRARLRTLLIAAGAEDIPGRLCDDDGLLEEFFEYAGW
jgi:hypothetical protein